MTEDSFFHTPPPHRLGNRSAKQESLGLGWQEGSVQDSPGDFCSPAYAPALRLGMRMGLGRVGNVTRETEFGDLLENKR